MGNADEPEGGFDALLQAMVCEREINWGNATRRLIIFATDADSHMAGDGKVSSSTKSVVFLSYSIRPTCNYK